MVLKRFGMYNTDIKPPDTENQRKRNKLLGEYRKTERYNRAKSCKHCTDIGDSFGRYLSTYCHIRQEHIAGSVNKPDNMDRCFDCELYKKRTTNKTK